MKYIDGKIQYEVGDWITYEKQPLYWSSTFSSNASVNIKDFPVTFQIEKINENGMLGMNYGWSVNPITGRPATQAEIDAALKSKVPEREIKVGDWVVPKNTSTGYTPGNVYKVKDICSDVIYTVLDDLGSVSNGWNKKWFRLATDVEITEFYKPKFKSGDIVYLHCTDTGNEYILCIKNPYDDGYEIKDYYDKTENKFRQGGTFYIRSERYFRKATPIEISLYKEKSFPFKVGDWVVQTRDFMIFPIDYKPHQIRGIANGVFYLENDKDGFSFSFDTFRLATKEEMAVTKTVKIRGHALIPIDNYGIKIGCKEFAMADVNTIYQIYKNYGIDAVTMEELKTIRDFYYGENPYV